MDSILERQRSAHEERERVVAAIVVENMQKKSSQRDQINSDHRILDLLHRSIGAAKKLESIYVDEDELRKEEISKIAGPNEFKEFYDRLKNIKDFHRTRPEDVAKPLSYEFEQTNLVLLDEEEEMPNMVEFSDEEGYGRFLDLHEHYQRFVNVKGFDKCDYLEYLGHFDKLFEINKDKKNAQYKDYTTHVSFLLPWFVSRFLD